MVVSSSPSREQRTPMESPETPSHTAIAVAAGESHSLALTGDGKVYAWGRGMFGRLGTGSEADELSPVCVKLRVGESDESTPKVVGIAAGAYHSLCVSGATFVSLDYPIDGQLGFSGDNSAAPRLMDKFTKLRSSDHQKDESEEKFNAPLKVSMVKAGGMMSLAIDKLGTLWMWGSCPLQENDNGVEFSLSSSSIPIPIQDFHGRAVVKVACGNEHVVALVHATESSTGDSLLCYSWGGNAHGQLGLGDRESRSRPEIVTKFSQDTNWAAYEVACGAFHTAWLVRRKPQIALTECACWTCGLGENGQLGHGTTQSSLVPEPVKDLPWNVYLTSVDCGLFHTSIVSSDGDVWSWGMERGLGLCPDCFSDYNAGDAVAPILIGGSKFHDPVQVSCGAAHTLLVASGGYKLWSWGRGRSGVLGSGNAIDCYAPSLVLWPPRTEEFSDEQLTGTGDEEKVVAKKDFSEGDVEADKRLSLALEEIKVLQTKLLSVERYASVLHGSIFGRPLEEHDIPVSLQESGNFDIAGAWESMLESADRGTLMRLEGFYRSMTAGVKDQLMKRRIKEIIEDCIESAASKGNGSRHLST